MKITILALVLLCTAPMYAQVGSGPSAPSSIAQADKFGNLTWTASTSTGVTYNVYRGIVAGGQKNRINPTPIAALAYRDASNSTPPPVFGVTNFYAVTAQRTSDQVESVPSAEISATAQQGSPAPPTNVNVVLAVLEAIGKAVFAVVKWVGASFLA